jgi:hypothetical protein
MTTSTFGQFDNNTVAGRRYNRKQEKGSFGHHSPQQPPEVSICFPLLRYIPSPK